MGRIGARARGSALVWMLVAAGAAGFAGAGYAWMAMGRQAAEPKGAAASVGSPAEFEYATTADGRLFDVQATPVALPSEAGLVPDPGSRGDRHAVSVSKLAAERAMASGVLPIVLPDGTRYAVAFDRAETAPNGDWTFVGRVATRLGPQSAVLTFGAAGVFGVLPKPDGFQLQITTSHGVTVLEPVRPMHPAAKPGAGPVQDFVLPEEPVHSGAARAHGEPAARDIVPSGSAAPPPAMAAAGESATDAIDIGVLGFYTSNMVSLRGSVAAAETEANNYLAIANQAHLDSGSRVRLAFVGLREIDYPATELNGKALYDLQVNALPDGTDVGMLRDSLEADLVAMLRPYVDGDTNGGIANLPAIPDDRFGFSVSNLSTYTFAHETGHNLGSMHDIETSTGINGTVQFGAFPYSFGYRQDGPPAFATVMAYPANGQPQIGYFSHPGTQACLGVTCGIAEQSDNARSLNEFAPGVSRYRVGQNLLLIDDTVIYEPDPGTGAANRSLFFKVRLSTPAPAGGVQFDLVTQDGTAVAGTDYLARTITGAVIPAGEQQYEFTVDVIPDALVEPDETFSIAILNVVGAGVYDGSATARILNEDPRLTISGRLVVPDGMDPPAYARLHFYMPDHGWIRDNYVDLQPPGFEYRLPVIKGSDVTVEVNLPLPFARKSYHLGTISESIERDIPLSPAVVVSGRVVFPNGAPAINAPIDVVVFGYLGDAWGTVLKAQPPDFEFSQTVPKGAEIRLVTRNVPAPYIARDIDLGAVTSDTVQDIELYTEPELYAGDLVVEESTVASFGMGFGLTAPAPAGGVSFDVETVPGTAVDGRDYLPVKEHVQIAEGASSVYVWVTVVSDDIAERDESFQLRASNIVGTWNPEVEATITITDDDPGVAIVDSNGDGASDLLWRNATLEQVDWWLMQGSARIGVGSQSMPANYRVAAQGDFNGDGLRDLVWEDDGRQELWMWLANAGGGFVSTSIGTFPQGGYVAVGAGDVDGDRRDDILFHSPVSGQLDWWLMNGTTRSGAAAQAIPNEYRVERVADFNGDGLADVLWSDVARTSLWAWLGQGARGFLPERIGAHPSGHWEIVGAGDINGDDRADLLWHDATAGKFDWWTMNGAARTGTGSQAIPPQYRVLGTTDLNADGKTDILWSETHRKTLWAWLAGSAGGFAAELLGDHPSGGWELIEPRPVYAFDRPGDIDGDGRSDVAWHSTAHQQFDWWRMQGATRLDVDSRFVDDAYEVAIRGDFNGDGLGDVLWRDHARSSLWLWQSIQGGGFDVLYVGVHPPAGWELVAAGDVDADGSDDLVWHNAGLEQMDWWRMHGNQRIGVDSRFVPGAYRVAGAGDLNGDGRLDLVWRDTARTELWAWLGVADGFSIEWMAAHPPAGWSLVAMGDTDGNRRADMIWHNPSLQEVDWWLMDGTQRTGIQRKYVGDAYRVIDSADYDGDGRIDLLWRDTGKTALWMWIGTGSDFAIEYVGPHPPLEWTPAGSVWP